MNEKAEKRKAGSQGIHIHVPWPPNTWELRRCGAGALPLASLLSKELSQSGDMARAFKSGNLVWMNFIALSVLPRLGIILTVASRLWAQDLEWNSLLPIRPLSFTSWLTSVNVSYYIICQLSTTLSMDSSPPLVGLFFPTSLQILVSSLSLSPSSHPANTF